MKQLTFILLLAVVLSSCSLRLGEITKDAFADDQVYQGYPCLDQCDAFQKGYDAARVENLSDPGKCEGSELEEITGCKAFIKDNKYDNLTFQELLTDF